MSGLNLTRVNMGGTAHRLEGERPSQYDPHSRVIECPSSVLHDPRATVLARFNSIPHGGSEIFGVLFGPHNNGDVHIPGFRALITDHEFAQPGELSDEECAAFASAMPAGTGQAGTPPVAAVGWFRSHPRSRLTLSERDIEIANTLFPQPWQVTLVLRPGNSASTRARIFFRESAGPLAIGAGFQEFIVDPPAVATPGASGAPGAELPPGMDEAPMDDSTVDVAAAAPAPADAAAGEGHTADVPMVAAPTDGASEDAEVQDDTGAILPQPGPMRTPAADLAVAI